MTKKASVKSIKGNRTYNVAESAVLLKRCNASIRKWIKNGLPVLEAKGPTLILGDDLRAFIVDRQATTHVSLAANELLCLTCKVGRKPLGMMVDYTPHKGKTGRISGLCDTCGGNCNRMVSALKLPDLSQTFDVAIRGRSND